MVIVRLGKFRRLATFSVATAVSLWAVEHYSDANSLWSSFRAVRFGRAAVAVRQFTVLLYSQLPSFLYNAIHVFLLYKQGG